MRASNIRINERLLSLILILFFICWHSFNIIVDFISQNCTLLTFLNKSRRRVLSAKTQTGGRYYDLIALFENQSFECAQKPNLIIVL
jgi:hypothetical protein